MTLPAEPANDPGNLLLQYFDAMHRRFGPQRWWPARTRLEVILGAILTQNTNWKNAVLALTALRQAGMLTLSRLQHVSSARLESLIRPAGFFRQKSRTILAFLSWLNKDCGGSLPFMFRRPAGRLRSELLAIKGLGPETVDAILLYAGRTPYFVADAYTRRILGRHGFLSSQASYATAQQFLHSSLPADSATFNEFHALLVEVGKQYCKRSDPLCHGCPLQRFLPLAPAYRTSDSQLGRAGLGESPPGVEG